MLVGLLWMWLNLQTMIYLDSNPDGKVIWRWKEIAWTNSTSPSSIELEQASAYPWITPLLINK